MLTWMSYKQPVDVQFRFSGKVSVNSINCRNSWPQLLLKWYRLTHVKPTFHFEIVAYSNRKAMKKVGNCRTVC